MKKRNNNNKNTTKINYEYLETPEGEESLNKAFDFLFGETMRQDTSLFLQYHLCMQMGLKKELIFYFEYAGNRIKVYPKQETGKAIEFRLFDSKDKLSQKTFWIPKSTFEKREGKELLDIDWIFNEYENREILEQIGYRL